MGPEFCTPPSPEERAAIAQQRETERANFMLAVREGVGQTLQLEFKRNRQGRHDVEDGVRGIVKETLQTGSDMAVVLTKVEHGPYVGEPEFGGGISYSHQLDGDKIVLLRDYSFLKMGELSASGSLFGV